MSKIKEALEWIKCRPVFYNPDLRAKVIRLLALVALLVLLALAGCSALYPMAGAGVGAGVGSAVGGPGGAALGSMAGMGVGEVLGAEGGGDVLAAAVEELGPEDIRRLVEAAVGEQQGFFHGLYGELVDLLKIAALIGALIMAAHIYITWKGQRQIKELKKGVK